MDKMFIMQLLMLIIGAVVAGVAVRIRKVADKWLDSSEKMSVARAAVLFVQQVYKELDGPAKMKTALETARKMLERKGIDFDAEEMQVLMEAAIGEFKEAFFRGEIMTGAIVYSDDEDDTK